MCSTAGTMQTAEGRRTWRNGTSTAKNLTLTGLGSNMDFHGEMPASELWYGLWKLEDKYLV
jgi:hypothetical protein